VAHFFKPLCKANLKTVAKQSYLWQERNCFWKWIICHGKLNAIWLSQRISLQMEIWIEMVHYGMYCKKGYRTYLNLLILSIHQKDCTYLKNIHKLTCVAVFVYCVIAIGDCVLSILIELYYNVFDHWILTKGK
jgi:hypothetical protein